MELNQKAVYSSMGLAARAIGERQSSISLYLSGERTAPFKKRYVIKKIEDTTNGCFAFGANNKIPMSVIEVTDLTNGGTKTKYYSLLAATKALNVPYSSIKYYIEKNSDKPYKNKYIFKKEIINKTD